MSVNLRFDGVGVSGGLPEVEYSGEALGLATIRSLG